MYKQYPLQPANHTLHCVGARARHLHGVMRCVPQPLKTVRTGDAVPLVTLGFTLSPWGCTTSHLRQIIIYLSVDDLSTVDDLVHHLLL